MSRVLVVEDSPTQARQIQLMLEDQGFAVDTAVNGREGLQAITRSIPDVVLTDLLMPQMNGLELVEAVRSKYPSVPVILMTAHGSEEIAAQALRQGAASYVPKRSLQSDIVPTLNKVLAVAGVDRQHDRLLECLAQADSHFLLDNDPSLIAPLHGHVQDHIIRMKLCDETALIRIGIALHEALANAIYHGNLELSSDLREGDGTEFRTLAEERRHQAPYRERRVYVAAKVSRTEAAFVVRDEGRGFDPSIVPDPTDPANLERVSGRGLLLIRTFMDDVTCNETCNQITMVKRCERHADS